MTPDHIGLLEYERQKQQDAIAEEYFEMGMADGAARELPAWIHEAYLSGYIAGVRQLASDAIGRIVDRSPDLPDPFYRLEDEF